MKTNLFDSPTTLQLYCNGVFFCCWYRLIYLHCFVLKAIFVKVCSFAPRVKTSMLGLQSAESNLGGQVWLRLLAESLKVQVDHQFFMVELMVTP